MDAAPKVVQDQKLFEKEENQAYQYFKLNKHLNF